METKWTVTHNSWEMSSVYDGAGNLVAEIPISSNVSEVTQDRFEKVKEERAHLIAAAPDLYGALAELVRMEDRDFAGISVRASEYLDAMENARAALARARGEPEGRE